MSLQIHDCVVGSARKERDIGFCEIDNVYPPRDEDSKVYEFKDSKMK